jgi:hypothetical protein
MSHQLLNLMEHVVIDLFISILFNVLFLSIVHTEQIVSKVWNHEELLHHRVHVANAAKVLQSNILLRPLKAASARWHIEPALGSLDGLNQWKQILIQESVHKEAAILDQLDQ